jgi:hypothetical protein
MTKTLWESPYPPVGSIPSCMTADPFRPVPQRSRFLSGQRESGKKPNIRCPDDETLYNINRRNPTTGGPAISNAEDAISSPSSLQDSPQIRRCTILAEIRLCPSTSQPLLQISNPRGFMSTKTMPLSPLWSNGPMSFKITVIWLVYGVPIYGLVSPGSQRHGGCEHCLTERLAGPGPRSIVPSSGRERICCGICGRRTAWRIRNI